MLKIQLNSHKGGGDGNWSRKPMTMTHGLGEKKHKRFMAADSSLFALKVIFLSLSLNVIPLNNSTQAFPPSGFFKVRAI